MKISNKYEFLYFLFSIRYDYFMVDFEKAVEKSGIKASDCFGYFCDLGYDCFIIHIKDGTFQIIPPYLIAKRYIALNPEYFHGQLASLLRL